KDRPDALRIEAPELRGPEIADLTGRLRLLLDMDLEEVAPHAPGTPPPSAGDATETESQATA
ncbi:MAG: hypothetical protein JNL94_12390, partial [Planctomycetes bacterium]|nr:hypothetical protein [Planctomycetota bacterium]